MAKKQGRSEEYVLNEKELQKYWDKCNELFLKVLGGLLAFCGLRVGEAIHLKLEWVRDEKIHIPSSMACACWECANHHKHPGFWKPKTKAGIRVVPLPGFLKPILKEFLSYQPQGLGMTRQAAHYHVKTLAKKAKLHHLFPHALRATAATTFAAKGLTAVELCYVMGWSRLEMGEHYVRISQARAGVEDKFKQIFG